MGQDQRYRARRRFRLCRVQRQFPPVRSSETFIELTYQAVVTPWWTLQPDFQYVFSPGGGIVDPNQPTKRVGDALILGLRTSITF